MANHSSAARRNRQTIRRTARNRITRGAMRTALKRVRAAIQSGNLDEAKGLMKMVESRIDKAATKGVVHRRKASRLKSRVFSQFHKLEKSGS